MGNQWDDLLRSSYATDIVRKVCDDFAFPKNNPYVTNDLWSRNQFALNMRIKNVIFNEPATIVFWGDGSKTVVKAQNGEMFDPEKGIAMAFMKKFYGNKGRYFNNIKKWAEKYEGAYHTECLGSARCGNCLFFRHLTGTCHYGVGMGLNPKPQSPDDCCTSWEIDN